MFSFMCKIYKTHHTIFYKSVKMFPKNQHFFDKIKEKRVFGVKMFAKKLIDKIV